jgi:hypothetical protein
MSPVPPPEFEYRGRYRVQSRLVQSDALLRGRWHEEDESLAALVDEALAAHPLHSKGRHVALRTAVGAERGGVFATCPDVLYKRELFEPDPNTNALPSNVVDLDKAYARWNEVAASLARVWASPDTVRDAVGDAGAAIRCEYFFHEAGHLVGIDVDAKTAGGHFRAGGRLAWPLVFVEEARADLHALAMAAGALQPRAAIAVFVYHVCIRLGVHALARADEPAPYGLVPYLLFVALRELDLIAIERTPAGDRFQLPAADLLLPRVRELDAWVSSRLTRPELEACTAIDRALVAAGHARCVQEHAIARDFRRVLDRLG